MWLPEERKEMNFACQTLRRLLQQRNGGRVAKNVLQEGNFKYAEWRQEYSTVQKMGYTIDYMYENLTTEEESEWLVTSEVLMRQVGLTIGSVGKILAPWPLAWKPEFDLWGPHGWKKRQTSL